MRYIYQINQIISRYSKIMENRLNSCNSKVIGWNSFLDRSLTTKTGLSNINHKNDFELFVIGFLLSRFSFNLAPYKDQFVPWPFFHPPSPAPINNWPFNWAANTASNLDVKNRCFRVVCPIPAITSRNAPRFPRFLR